MKRTLYSTLGALLLCGGAFAQGSDDCSSAQSISGCGLFDFDNTVATQDGAPDLACFKFGTSDIDFDVWFSWAAPANGNFSFETCGLTGVDTKLAVYEDMGMCPPFPAIDCDDDDDCLIVAGPSKVFVNGATEGTVYLLRVGTFPGAVGGPGQFLVSGCPEPIGTNFCVSTANSTGAAATIAGFGSGGLTVNDLVLEASDVPQAPGLGIFIASLSGTQQLPFFDGFLCLAAPVLRINTVTPPVGGVVTQSVDASAPPIGAMPGDTVWFQHWFRDPAAGASGANFTNGLEVMFTNCPASAPFRVAGSCGGVMVGPICCSSATATIDCSTTPPTISCD